MNRKEFMLKKNIKKKKVEFRLALYSRPPKSSLRTFVIKFESATLVLGDLKSYWTKVLKKPENIMNTREDIKTEDLMKTNTNAKSIRA